MWPAFDLSNRGVFMELGSLRLIGRVSSEVYEGKIEAKKCEKIRGERRGKKRRWRRIKKKEKKKEKGFSRSGWECSLSFRRGIS